MWYFIAGACAGVGCICICEFMFKQEVRKNDGRFNAFCSWI